MWIYNVKIFQSKIIIKGAIEYSENTGYITKVTAKKTINDGIRNNGIDGKGKFLIPGMVDIHVHLRDLDQQSKETFESGSKSALFNGVTTIFDMPNKIPTIDNYEIIRKIQGKTKTLPYSDIFHYILLNNASLKDFNNLSSLTPYWKVVFGGTTNIKTEEYEILNKLKNKNSQSIFLSIHAEDSEIIQKNLMKYENTPSNHPLIRSNESEFVAVKKIYSIINNFPNKHIHFHFAHISTFLAHEFLKSKSSSDISWEVSPHHLLLSTDNIPDLKEKSLVNPPLRDKANQKKLLQAFLNKEISILATDHAPHSLNDKLSSKQSGLPGLDGILPVLITNNVPIPLIVKTYSENPAKLAHLYDRGIIQEGFRADLVLLDPNLELTFDDSLIYSKAQWNAWEGKKLKGWSLKVWKKGKLIFERN